MTTVARFCLGCDCHTGNPQCWFCYPCAKKICSQSRDELWEPSGNFRGLLEICRIAKETAPERIVARAQKEIRIFEKLPDYAPEV